MDAAPGDGTALTDEWITHHFDYLAPEFARDLHPTLARMRTGCPVTHSDAREGYWAVTRYEDVLRVAQDWETYSSELGVGIPATNMVTKAIPEHIDPPLHRAYKRLINGYFTPNAVTPLEDATRAIITKLIDDVIESGECDFMADIASPFPGRAFFELVLNAPPDEAEAVAHLAQRASIPNNPDSRECWQGLNTWINAFLDGRRQQPSKGDVVDAILRADIDGRPITDEEVLGLVLLLILGGLETTAGALGAFMLRFLREPAIPALLRDEPERIPDAVEELLRLEGPFIAIGRTVRHDTELDGHRVAAGEKVYISFASANRDEDEFPRAEAFDLERERNRHIAFGAGPHRCAGSNLARLNLRVALAELLPRLRDIELVTPEGELPFHTAFNRSPLAMPIRFTPGARVG